MKITAKKYVLAEKNNTNSKTKIKFENNVIGENLCIIAGPCSVEEEATTLRIAEKLTKIGIKFFRAGAYKPRNSPYSFQGLREEGLKILTKVRKETGLKIVTEIINDVAFNAINEVADILQVGAKNMGNSTLLKKLGKCNKPILLKRGMAAQLDELLFAAEYILLGGNPRVILCERGIRTFNNYTRFTLDLAAVPTLQKITHLPIFVDPSHATGNRDLVAPMSKAAVAAGADGLLIEVHENPEQAWSDASQTININTLANLMKNLHALAGTTNC